MDNQQDIIFATNHQLGIVTLNRPQAMNASTPEMKQALYAQLDIWANDPSIKAIVLKNAGNKAFCAGGDLRAIYNTCHNKPIKSQNSFWHEYRLNHRIFHYPKPYVSLMNGITMGGGAGISINGSHRIATENFIFAMPETGIGFFPDAGGSYFLPRCPGQTGIYLGLTGARIQAADALDLKLIDAYIPNQKLTDFVNVLAQADFTDNPHDTVTTVMQQFSEPLDTPPLKIYQPHIELCFAHHTVENILTALKKHSMDWTKTVIETLKQKSPTSLKIALQALRHGAMLDFDQCMQMEFRLAVHFLQQHDFYEGIRATIIDKDNQPIWQPSNLSDVSLEVVENYFAPLTDIEEINFA